jgi:HAD superfamily hydrolase (TIGR01509 family)
MGRKALLFDLDGTLIHSDPLHFEIFAEMFAARGQAIDMAYYMAHIHGTHNLECFPKFFPGEDAIALADAKEAEFRKRLDGPQPPMPGAPELFARARDLGWGIAIVTNAARHNAEQMLRAIGLDQAFDVLVIGDECARGKPDPEPYLSAMRALNVAPAECIAFEDSPSGLQAARASGAFTVGLSSTADNSSLRANGAQHVIENFNDTTLPAILARLTGETVT